MGVAGVAVFTPTLALPPQGGGNESSWPFELEAQVLPHRRPLALDDAEHHRIAIAAVGRDLVIAQHRILLRAESGDRGARRMIEPVRPEFDCDAFQFLEGVRHQEQLAFGIDRTALGTPRIPRVPDFQAAIRDVDVEVASAADDRPSLLSRTTKGIAARRSRTSSAEAIYALILSAGATPVYQRRQSSPSAAAWLRASSCDDASGSSAAWSPLSVTGSMKAMSAPPSIVRSAP